MKSKGYRFFFSTLPVGECVRRTGEGNKVRVKSFKLFVGQVCPTYFIKRVKGEEQYY